MKHAIIATTLLTIVWASAQPKAAGPVRYSDRVIIGPSEVVMPPGVFLLVRKTRQVGAIRFTSIVPGKEFATGKATYDSYFQGDGSASLVAPNVVRRSGEIDVKPLKGIGRASFQLGHTTIHIGKWKFGCDDPGVVNMFPAGFWAEQKDYGYEFAPTAARQVNEINALDMRLRWFRFDVNRAGFQLLLADLPK